MASLPLLSSIVAREHLAGNEMLLRVFDTIGQEAFAKLIEECGGMRITIPLPDTIDPLVIDFVKRFYDEDKRYSFGRHLNLTQSRLAYRLTQAFGEKPRPKFRK